MEQKTSEEWYGNKDLFEMFVNLKKEFLELKADLSLTRQFIKQYNHLQQTLNTCIDKINILEQIEDVNRGFIKGRSDIIIGFRKWGGWLIAVAASAVAIYAHFT